MCHIRKYRTTLVGREWWQSRKEWLGEGCADDDGKRQTTKGQGETGGRRWWQRPAKQPALAMVAMVAMGDDENRRLR